MNQHHEYELRGYVYLAGIVAFLVVWVFGLWQAKPAEWFMFTSVVALVVTILGGLLFINVIAPSVIKDEREDERRGTMVDYSLSEHEPPPGSGGRRDSGTREG